MKNSQHLLRWVYPLLLGIVQFNTLRLVTDFSRNSMFWSGELQEHIIAQAVTVAFAYLFDYFCRKMLGREKSAVANSLLVACPAILFLNLLLFAGTGIGFLKLGNGWLDCLLINIVYIPLLMIYYAILRMTYMNRKYEEQQLMIEKIRGEQLQAELNSLKAQYHPHFLFNALNTIYFQINESNVEARKGVELLSKLLRFQVYNSDRKVKIEQEIAYMEAYIDFQKLRMPERLQIVSHFDRPLPGQTIYPLLFQPLLENAFKYVAGEYRITVDLSLSEEDIVLCIENTVLPEESRKREERGMGIRNLRRRLDLLYPQHYALFLGRCGNCYSAKLKIRLQ